MPYAPSRQACKRLGIHRNTLQKWANAGRIDTIRTPGGQRRYDVDGFLGASAGVKLVCYCRVSSAKQKDDLGRQVAVMQERFPRAEIVKDIGSGLNWKRKGLLALLERAVRGEKLEVVVAHRDRLARFGHEIVRWIIEQPGGKLVVLDQATLSPDVELGQDLCAIIHVFSCRINGRRKYKVKADQNISDDGAEDRVSSMVRRVAACVQQDCRELACEGHESELDGDQERDVTDAS